MRIYKTDGTFVDNEKDTEFGWSLDGIVIDQRISNGREFGNNSHDVRSNSKSSIAQLRKEEAFLESVDIVEPEPEIPKVVKHVKVNIKTEPIVNVINCKMDIEGLPVEHSKSSRKRLDNEQFTVPSKEELSELINPCNIETKALMSVIYFAKYKSLIKEETSAELFKTVNFKTTNSKCLIKDKTETEKEEMLKDIQHYYATSGDNMLSLMMEMILADIGCNLEDIVDIDERINEATTNSRTGGLTNGVTSYFDKEWNSSTNNTLNESERSSILSSIGLDDEDRSVQSICEETQEMRFQTAEIKESFHNEENRVNHLIKMTTALKEEVRETLYLDDILHLLEGNLEKVKVKKLPFKIFYKKQKSDMELNLIV